MTPSAHLHPVDALAVLVVLALATSVAVAVPAFRRGERARAWQRMARVLLVGAVLAVGTLTIGNLVTRSVSGLNLRPGAGIAAELHNVNRSIGMLNIVGNVLMFVPVGLLLPLAVGTRWRTSTLLCAGLSLVIELVQLVQGRSADIDDVLLNTLGGALGAALGVWVANAVSSGRTDADLRG